MSALDPALANGPLQQQALWLENYDFSLSVQEQGTVLSVGDGIVWISGLPSAAVDDILLLEDGSRALVFDLSDDLAGAMLLNESKRLGAGSVASPAGHVLSVPVGDGLLGRIVDPLGHPLDGKSMPESTRWQNLESPSPPIIARDFVKRPLYTGIRIIDTMIPIGMGQRQLIIGDEGLGRSSIAIDTVVNQRGKGVYCIYVLIGQKRSTVVNTITLLRDHQALDHTTVVVAEASSVPALQYLAPFAGCAIGEYWMQNGKDVLVVYDDLATHAKTYRELSLLLRRPPGREAYPGDIFSVHARLLERATCLNATSGGGSLTALPIVATQQGEIAAYIPTNLISITDGQIYLERHLFTSGFRPAIDITRSVSRIGGQAQHVRIKQEAGRMKLDYLQFLELERFTRFGARLDADMEAAIVRGRVLREILKQDRLSPLPVEAQLAWLIAFNEGYLSGQAPAEVQTCLDNLETQVVNSSLNIEAPRQDWLSSVATWCNANDKVVDP